MFVCIFKFFLKLLILEMYWEYSTGRQIATLWFYYQWQVSSPPGVQLVGWGEARKTAREKIKKKKRLVASGPVKGLVDKGMFRAFLFSFASLHKNRIEIFQL